MSDFTGMNDDELWNAVNRYLDFIPLAENRELVLRYVEERRANGIKPATLGIDVNALRSLGVFMGERPFAEATKADMIRYFNTATGKRTWRTRTKDGGEVVSQKEIRLSFSTREKRKEVFKPFYRWVLGIEEGQTPPQFKGIKSRKTSHENVPVDQLLTPEDLRAMLLHAKDDQQRAAIAVLYESGLRAGEFIALNIGSVVFDEYGAVLTLPKGAQGLKTGSRRVRLFDSVSYLQKWYELHPQKDDPAAPLWLTLGGRGGRSHARRFALSVIYNLVRDTARRAGVKKHVHPHLFRHTAATERARMGWNEGQMRAFFGWSKNSDMPSWYVHLAGMDYENVEIERRGLKGREPAGPALKPLVCRVCRTENPMTSTFCSQCRNPVSPAAEAEVLAQKQEALKEEAARILAGLSKEELAALVRDQFLGTGRA